MNNKSFTLIELLVVIVIIGILAGVIMISTSSSIDKANIAKSKVFEESIANDLAVNMISRWKLDGDFTDSWGVSNGTSIGVTFSNESQCISGQCGSFNAASGIDCGSNADLNITGDMSISSWIKTNSTAQQTIVYRGIDGLTQVWFVDVFTNKFRFGFANEHSFGVEDIVYGNIQVNNDKWHYLVATFNGNKMVTYVDSIIDDGKNKTTLPSSTLTKTFIGANKGTSNYFNGQIDDVRIYDAALSSSQIKQNYIAGLDFLLSKGSILKEEYNQRINELAHE